VKSLRRFVLPLAAVLSALVGAQAAHAAPVFRGGGDTVRAVRCGRLLWDHRCAHVYATREDD
jgi:hypothetical protein